MKSLHIHITRMVLTLSLLAAGSLPSASAASQPEPVRLSGHIPAAIATAQVLGRVAPTERIQFAFVLPLRNQAELDGLLRRLYDPADPEYGLYLTPEEFTERFGPTQADYDAVKAYAAARGLKVAGTHPNRTILDVEAPAPAVEAAFGLHLLRYRARDGHAFYAPDTDPSVPAEIAHRIVGMVGLDNAVSPRPLGIGTGPNGGLSPSDIKKAYNLNGLSLNGSGQTLAVFTEDGYKASDITSYETKFALTTPTLQNVLIDNFSGAAGTNSSETTLDIELQIAMAPGATKILVYESPKTFQGEIDGYNRVANDDLAAQISTSWGEPESSASDSMRTSENAAFQQMAAQGQTIYAASGDNGAKDDGSNLSVDNPASQPYVCGVGGTRLTLNTDGTYKSETTWNNATGAGGGGVSAKWSRPAYQNGLGYSATARNVPDVALNSDPLTGYAIFLNGSWTTFGGTSCAAPLWAGFTALVNQQRAANGIIALGFANQPLYALVQSYSGDFHDIADGSSNGFYTAQAGYDDATGWGSFNGANLLAHLSRAVTQTFVSTGPDDRTRLVDTYSDGAISIRTVDRSGTILNFQVYGPFSQWTAVGTATGPDNVTRILWNRTDGTISIWRMDSLGNYMDAHPYGAYPNWSGRSISVGADNRTRVLWTDTNNSTDIWLLDASENLVNSIYWGPTAAITAKLIATSAGNYTFVLQQYVGNGAIWFDILDPNLNFVSSGQEYGPYSAWTPKAIGFGPDNVLRLVWDNTDGTGALWKVSGHDGSFLSSTYYGPWSGWSAASVAVGNGNVTRLLWLNTNGLLSLFWLDTDGNYLQNDNYYRP